MLFLRSTRYLIKQKPLFDRLQQCYVINKSKKSNFYGVSLRFHSIILLFFLLILIGILFVDQSNAIQLHLYCKHIDRFIFRSYSKGYTQHTSTFSLGLFLSLSSTSVLLKQVATENGLAVTRAYFFTKRSRIDDFSFDKNPANFFSSPFQLYSLLEI